MSTLDPVSDADLRALLERTQAEFAVFRDRGLALDMIHDKPSPEQLDLYHAMLTLPGTGIGTSRLARAPGTTAAVRDCLKSACSDSVLGALPVGWSSARTGRSP